MNTESNRGRSVSSLFVYVLIGLFALLCVLAVLLGAGVFRSVSKKQEEHATERILTAYLRGMVRSHAEAGSISVEKGDNGDVLVLSESYDDEAFTTRLYCYEGSLCEQFTYAEDPFEPDSGEYVCDAASFSVEPGKGVLNVSVTGSDGTPYSVTVAAPGCGEGGAE